MTSKIPYTVQKLCAKLSYKIYILTLTILLIKASEACYMYVHNELIDQLPLQLSLLASNVWRSIGAKIQSSHSILYFWYSCSFSSLEWQLFLFNTTFHNSTLLFWVLDIVLSHLNVVAWFQFNIQFHDIQPQSNRLRAHTKGHFANGMRTLNFGTNGTPYQWRFTMFLFPINKGQILKQLYYTLY
jgi:hypothetical protein